MKHQGKIVFYKGVFGFIACNEFEYNLFFLENDLLLSYRKKAKRGDIVSFVTVPNLKKKGQKKAARIRFIKYIPHTLEDLEINKDEHNIDVGELISWNGRGGIIKCPSYQKKDIFLYYTRYTSTNLKIGDLIVFHPVDSINPQSTYFALFAYPISFEDKERLLRLYPDYGFKAPLKLKKYLQKNYPKDFLLVQINQAIREQDIEEIIANIKRYKSEFGESSKINIGFNQLSVENQVYLFELGYYQSIEVKPLIEYFKRGTKRTKYRILEKASSEKQLTILREHTQWICQTGRINNLSREVKSILDLLKTFSQNQGTPEQRIIDIQKNFIQKLFQLAYPEKIINLWLNGYLDKLPSIEYAISNFDFEELDNVKKLTKIANKNQFNSEAFKQLFEFYIQEFSNDSFGGEYPILVHLLNEMERNSAPLYLQDIEPFLRKIFSYDQLFILKTFGVKISPTFDQLIKNTGTNIPLVYLIYASKTYNLDLTEAYLKACTKLDSLKDNLKNELVYFNWNALINLAFFLKDIFPQWTHSKNLDDLEGFENQLAVDLYDILPKTSVQRIKLWLTFHKQLKDKFDYYNFAEGFKKLSIPEKKELRDRLKRVVEEAFIESDQLEVISCENYREENGVFIYTATLRNLYFKSDSLLLRMHNGSITQEFKNDYVSSGLNRIPWNSKLMEREIEVSVEKNKIIDIKGFDQIIEAIYKKGVEDILAKKQQDDYQAEESSPDYVTDLNLKKEIIQFLEDTQAPGVEIIQVYENVTPFSRCLPETQIGKQNRRKDLNQLFTLDLGKEVAIILECSEIDRNRSTFIFKSTKQSLNRQLNRIKDCISKYKNMRSYLISNFRNEITSEYEKKVAVQEKMKNYLGYIGNIRKRRGKIDAFQRWQTHLEEVIKSPIPNIDVEFDLHDYDWEDYGLYLYIENTKLEPKPKDGSVGIIIFPPENPPPDPPEINLDHILSQLGQLEQQFLQDLKL